MNLVRDLHYFIYLEFSLLILFLKVDADHRSTDNFKDVMELIRPTNAENNEANRIEPEFTLFCEKNAENVVEMLNLAWNFIQHKVQHYLIEKTPYSEVPLELTRIQIIKSILRENLKLVPLDDLENLCKNSWATYSNGIVPPLSSVNIQGSAPVEFPQEQQIDLPMLTCTFQQNFRLFILVLYDPENPSKDIRFLYIYAFSYELFAYIREIAKDHNDRNINRNQGENRR